MSEIPSIQSSAASSIRPVQAKAAAPAAPTAAPAGAPTSDTVEISREARVASMLSGVPDVRQDLVSRVKAEIKAGTYLTPEKLDVAIDRLMDELSL